MVIARKNHTIVVKLEKKMLVLKFPCVAGYNINVYPDISLLFVMHMALLRLSYQKKK